MARTVGGLEDLADAIEAAGGPTPTLVPLSITDEVGMQRLCLAIHDRWGRADLVVHCAAHAAPLTPANQIAAKDFDSSVEVNLRGTQRLIAMTAPLLAAAASGTFVHVTDDHAGGAFWGSYGATRAAGDALARSWAAETARIGPRVVLFQPAPMPTALRARFYPAEEPTPAHVLRGRGGAAAGAAGGGDAGGGLRRLRGWDPIRRTFRPPPTSCLSDTSARPSPFA